MKKSEMTILAMLAEAVGLVSAMIYLGLQIYYAFAYDVKPLNVGMNILVMLLVYAGLTLLAVYPERVNGLSSEVCSGDVRMYTIRMVRLAKLIFVEGLLFACICDVMGMELNAGYSLVVVVLMVLAAFYYEYRIIKILRKRYKK